MKPNRGRAEGSRKRFFRPLAGDSFLTARNLFQSFRRNWAQGSHVQDLSFEAIGMEQGETNHQRKRLFEEVVFFQKGGKKIICNGFGSGGNHGPQRFK